MTMTVTMTQTRMGESGSLLVAGSSYSVSDAFGAFLVGAGLATDPYRVLTPPQRITEQETPPIKSLVSGAGNITAAELATTTGTLGQTVRLSDGDNKGAILMWSTPAGSSTPAWCWWLWPQSPYEA